MSDFGTVLEVNGIELIDERISSISVEIRSYFEEKGIKNEVGKAYLHNEVIKEPDNSRAIFVLTEYYYSGNEIEDNDLFEFISEVEGGIVQGLIDHLKSNSDFDYNFKTYTDNW